MSFSVGGSTGGSTTSSRPVLFKQKDTQTKEQQRAAKLGGRSILDDALKGGFSPEEASADFARRADPVNRAFKTSTGDLSRLLGRSGLSGGAANTDFSALLGERIQGIGAAAGESATASLTEADRRKQKLLQLLSLSPQALIASRSKGESKEGVQAGLKF